MEGGHLGVLGDPWPSKGRDSAALQGGEELWMCDGVRF